MIDRKPFIVLVNSGLHFLKTRKGTFYHFSGVGALRTLVIMHLRVVIYNFSLCSPNIPCEFLRLKTDRKWKYCLDVNIFLHGIIFDMFWKLFSLGFRKFPASSILGCSQLFDTQQANTQGLQSCWFLILETPIIKIPTHQTILCSDHSKFDHRSSFSSSSSLLAMVYSSLIVSETR